MKRIVTTLLVLLVAQPLLAQTTITHYETTLSAELDDFDSKRLMDTLGSTLFRTSDGALAVSCKYYCTVTISNTFQSADKTLSRSGGAFLLQINNQEEARNFYNGMRSQSLYSRSDKVQLFISSDEKVRIECKESMVNLNRPYSCTVRIVSND